MAAMEPADDDDLVVVEFRSGTGRFAAIYSTGVEERVRVAIGLKAVPVQDRNMGTGVPAVFEAFLEPADARALAARLVENADRADAGQADD
jgi:hypothetical protein